MTIEEMVGRVQGWITDQSRSTEESLEIAEHIHDLCEEWIDALQHDLEVLERAAEMARDD